MFLHRGFFIVKINYVYSLKLKYMNEINDLKTYVIELSNDFTDDYLTTSELQQRFINQVIDYGSECCKTEQELLCYVDGLLMNI